MTSAGATEAITVAMAFEHATADYAQNDFLQVLPDTAKVFAIEPRTYTYAQAADEVVHLRERYSAAGYGPGHRVGLLLLNRPEFLFHFLALNGLGASVVPINADWRIAELEYLIGHSEIVLAVSLDDRAGPIRAAASATGAKLVVTGPALSGLVGPCRKEVNVGGALGATTEAALLYTSGTTGRPKGCVLTNEYFLHCGRWYNSVGGLCDVRPGLERMLTPLPLTHMNAMAVSTMCMLMSGGCLVLLDRFHPAKWWQSVRESRATMVHYLGVMPAMLLGAEPSRADRDHDVRFGFGAGVNPRHHQAFEDRFGFPLVEAWAMTETGSGAVIVANREPRYVGTACFGAAAPEVECRVVDAQGADVAVGAPGELLVRHAGGNPKFGFFDRYLKDPEATAEAWSGGWFHTGDLVTRDERGQFRFVDRKKNVIRRSGENISAAEVESVLGQHPSVKAVGVTAVADPVRGDEVFAVVVPRDPAAASRELAAEITGFCRERLAYFKAPGYVAFSDALPLTATEKIQRATLRDVAAGLLATACAYDLRTLKRRDEG